MISILIFVVVQLKEQISNGFFGKERIDTYLNDWLIELGVQLSSIKYYIWLMIDGI